MNRQMTIGTAVPAVLMLMLGTVIPAAAESARSGDGISRGTSGVEWSGENNDPSGERRRKETQGRRVSGDITRAKKVRVLGSEVDHLVVLVRTEAGRPIVVDLGPIDDLRRLHLRPGDWITAQGPIGRIGDRPVMMAHRLMTDEREWVVVNRQRQRVSGTIERTKTVKLRGSQGENLLARIKTEDGQRMLVDLGDAASLRAVPLRPGTHVSVRGPSVRIGEERVMMARQLRIAGETRQIARQEPGAGEGPSPAVAAQRQAQPRAAGPVAEALRLATRADQAAMQQREDDLIRYGQAALRKAEDARRGARNERLDEAVYALRDAVEHAQQGEADDAREHLQHAILRLSQSVNEPASGRAASAQTQADRPALSEQARTAVGAAIDHARQAKQAAQQGQNAVMLQHAKSAVRQAMDAQQTGDNERLSEAVYALGDAVDHASQGHRRDAGEHFDHAIAALSQAAGRGADAQGASPQPSGGGREAAMTAPSTATGEQETIAGQVVVSGELVRIGPEGSDREDFYIVRDPSGREVNLLIDDSMKADLQLGDKIVAETKSDGTVTSIRKEKESERSEQR